MKKVKQRDPLIDICRFCMALIIIIYHINFHLNELNNPFMFRAGYRCVDIFFVFSGFYLCKGIIRKADQSFAEFLQKKIVRLYPTYIICYSCYFILALLTGTLPRITGQSGIKQFIYIPVDLVLAQNWGGGLPSLGDWYISALVLGMALIFLTWKICRNNTYIVAGGLSILMLVILAVIHGNLNIHEPRFHISAGVIRAYIGLSIGWIAYEVSARVNKTKSMMHIILFMASIIVTIMLMFIHARSLLDFLTLPVAALVIVSGTGVIISNGHINRSAAFLGSISFPIYLIHTFVRETISLVNASIAGNIFINIIWSVILAIIINKVSFDMQNLTVGRTQKQQYTF